MRGEGSRTFSCSLLDCIRTFLDDICRHHTAVADRRTREDLHIRRKTQSSVFSDAISNLCSLGPTAVARKSDPLPVVSLGLFVHSGYYVRALLKLRVVATALQSVSTMLSDQG